MDKKAQNNLTGFKAGVFFCVLIRVKWTKKPKIILQDLKPEGSSVF